MVFMLIRRWALLVCIALGAHTQAHAMFNPFPTPQTTFQIEMPQTTVNAVSGTSFWQTFLTKVNWRNFGARLPGACIVGSAPRRDARASTSSHGLGPGRCSRD